MKKLFLIPLLTLVCSVMAWADPVTTLEELQAALNEGGEVTLGAPIDAGATAVTFSSGTATLDLGEYSLSSTISASGQTTKGGLVISGGSLTIKGSGSITAASGNAIYMSAGELIINSGTISGKNEGIFAEGGSITINNGTINGTNDNAIWSRGDAITINGGTLTGGWGAIQADNNIVLTITGGEFTGADQDVYMDAWSSIANPSPSCSISGGTFNGNGIIVGSGNLVVTGGTFAVNPVSYLDVSSYVAILEDDKYVVSAPAADVVAYNQTKCITYASLSAAVEDASAADVIYLYKNDASAVTVAKNITIKTNGHTTNLSAGAGFSRADMGQNVVFTDNAIAAFLMADGTNSMTIDADANIATAGQIIVNGTKTLTIADGVTIYYERQASGANILVPDGATLTILGNGTFNTEALTEAHKTAATSTQLGNRAIDVSGTLIVGAEGDGTNIPHFITTSPGRGSAIMVNPTGKAYLYNADIQAASLTIWNEGRLEIFDGNYVSTSSLYYENNGYVNAKAENWRAYGTQGKAGSYTMIHGGHFQGIQGCVCFVDGALADIEGGTFETVHYSEEHPYNHYALFVATGAIVNVRGGKFSIETPGNGGHTQVILIGDNDAGTTFGIINLYGGIFQQKPYLSHRKAQDAEMIYPASIPTSSQWYSSFGTNVPLPAGYEYYNITEGADYEAGYRYGVKVVDGKEADAISPAQQAVQEADPTYTIPWQQATTWAAAEVPEENTIVTIPVDATVTVSKDEATKEAVADQVFVAQGATLKVEEGTTLTVGDGGMNIGNGGQIVVEAGATVKIGAAGIITTEEEALVIESSEEIQGTLIYDPAVSENTQPKASVRLYTKCYQKHASPYEYQWQRFAIPLIEMVSKPANDYVDQPLFAGQSEFKSYLFGWGGESWVQPANGWLGLEPNKGYQVANNTIAGGITYTFHGNLIANNNGNYDFEANGFSFFGNSYTAPINVRSLLNEFNNQGGFEHTIHVYDMEGDGFIAMTQNTFDDYDEGMLNDDEIKQEIASMQAFIIKGAAGEAANMSYETSIWNPLVNPSNNAPQRRSVSSNRDIVVLNVAANGKKDRITLRQSDEFSAEFDNSADASKYMNEGTFNIYANTEIGDLAEVSTDELNNTILGFQSAEATEYTLTCSGQKGESFILRDLLTGAEVNLEKGATYTFAQQPNTTNEARFQIVDGRMAPTAVENVQNVKKAEGIYTVLGKYLGAADQLDKLPAGMYIVNGVKIVK